MNKSSIHYRRRWFYALWCALLVCACAALVLWELPARKELASLRIQIKVNGAPEGTRVRAWAGPWPRWKGATSMEEGTFSELPLPAGEYARFATTRIPIARRRWVQDFIPRGTSDLVMLQFMPPAGPPKYMSLPLAGDIRQGTLKAKRILIVDISNQWQNLTIDDKPLNRVP